MASLALGIAGAIIGSFFGMGSLGFALGSALGSALFPPKGPDGPRLTDLKMQQSQYGQMIPILYGTIRVASNVIWQTDLVEHKHKSGGKGGAQQTTYTYTASFACLLCEGPILGIKRIWADSRLIYNGAGTDANLKPLPMTIYFGTEDQLPDPTMEADKGVGNVPAHRGEAYVVFTDMELGDYGNRIPILTFEVVATQTEELQRINRWPAETPTPTYPLAGVAGMRFDGAFFYMSNYWGPFGPLSFGPPHTYFEDKYDFAGNYIERTIESFTLVPIADVHSVGAYQCRNGNQVLMRGIHNDGTSTWVWYVAGAVAANDVSDQWGFKATLCSGTVYYNNGYLYTIGGGGAPYVARWDAPLGVPTGAISAWAMLPSNAFTLMLDFACGLVVADDGTVWVAQQTISGNPPHGYYHYDADLNLLHEWSAGTGVAPMPASPAWASWVVWQKYHVFYISGGGLTLYRLNDDYTFTFLDLDPGDVRYWPVSLGNGYFLAPMGVFKIGTPITLASIVSDLSVRSGLTTAQIDVTELTDLVDGYAIAQQTTARNDIQPLRSPYFFDAVESDNVIKFPKRDRASVVTIPDDDLGAAALGNEAPPLLTTDRVQEVELPRTMSVKYLNRDADYLDGEQHAQRAATSSLLDITAELPIVLTDTKAKSAAETLLYGAWVEREQFTIYTGRKYAWLEPTDVITAQGREMRIRTREEQTDGVIKWTAAASSAQLYSTAAASVGGPMNGGTGYPITVAPMLQFTDLKVLDIPLVKDSDAANGYYAAMSGTLPAGWIGAGLFKSVDAGSSYNLLVTNAIADSIGVATTALGNFLSGYIFDEANTVTVIIDKGSPALESLSAANVLSGGNLALLGNEVISFKVATLTAAYTYQLSGLLRGRRGTEWAMTTHAIGDRFVLLPTSLNLIGAFAEINAPIKFKPVTIGNTLAMTTAVDFTNTGIALRCYAPVQLGGGRNASADLIINWVRRARTGGDLSSSTFADVALDEVVEKYRVRYYSNFTYVTVKRTVIVTGATTTTYTNTDQTTDFGVAPATMYFDVAQLGALDYGTPARGIA